jgi:hypothetical protein
MYRMDLLPVLSLPPDLPTKVRSDFSGVEVVISPKVGAILCLCPGVVGFSFLIAAIILLIKYWNKYL